MYRTTDTKLKRQVALKVREAEVLAPLNPPNIAQIYRLALEQ